MDNATRRQLLQRHRQSGFPGSILDVYRAYDQGVDLIGQFEQQNNIQVANTPEQFQQGLRPAHQAGDVNRSMVFPDVPPNTPFNTMGMKAPINIQKFDNQGHLVKSYENVPPGIRSLPTGPQRGTVIETPAQMQDGGVRKYQGGSFVAESTYQPSFAEQAFLNQQNALPTLDTPRYRDEGTIREGNFEVDKDNNIVEDRPSVLEMAANPMATARAIIDPSVEGLPSQVEFDQAKEKGTGIGQFTNDVFNPAAWANYGVNAYQDFGDATGYILQGEGQKALQSAGSGAINLLGAVPGVGGFGRTAAAIGKQALNATAGQAARNIAYNLVTPYSYTPRFLRPKDILKNVRNPYGRATGHRGFEMSYMPYRDAGMARRLDALALGLGKTPRYNTFQKIGDNLYEPVSGATNVRDILKTTEDALNERLALTGELGKRGSTVDVDRTFDLMGGYNLVDEAVPNNPMLRRITMNDTWDLHPFKDYGVGHFASFYPATRKMWDALPTHMQDNISNRLQNLEVLTALGGKPINIQSSWTAKMADDWATKRNVGDIVLTNDATGRSFTSYGLHNSRNVQGEPFIDLNPASKPNYYKTGGIRKLQAAGFNTAESTAQPNYAEQAFRNVQTPVLDQRMVNEVEMGIPRDSPYYDDPAGLPTVDPVFTAATLMNPGRFIRPVASKAINLSKSAMPESMQILKLQNQAARMPRSMRQAELDFIDNAKNILNTARREDMGAISALKNQADDVIRQADDLYNPTRIQERLTPLDADRIDVTRYLSNQPISRNQRGGFIRRRR